MKTISTEASVLSRLVDDMIEFLQWASGQMAMKKDVVDLCSHVDETVKRVHGRYADKNLRITTPGLERLEISADAHSLQGCLERAVDNAMKFSYPEGKVDVRVESTVVIVRDRGQGIASENLQELYKVRPCAAPTRTTPAAAA